MQQALRPHTLKRRRSSMYEASGFFAVTSASSAFSVPVASIFASCKPALLCSDRCGADAVHSVCRCSCGQLSVSAQGDGGFAPDRLMGPGHADKSGSACSLRVRLLLASGACAPGGSMQHATRDRRHGVYDTQTCNVRRTTPSIHAPAMPCVADDARSMPCSELQRDGCGKAELCRCASMCDRRHAR
jgi:hypothetical protein